MLNRKKVVASIIQKNNKFLLAQRAKKDTLYQKWEFPGGKLESRETYEECLKRELYEEFGIRTTIGEYLCSSYFEHNGNSYEMLAFFVTAFQGNFTLYEHSAIAWVSLDEVIIRELLKRKNPIHVNNFLA